MTFEIDPTLAREAVLSGRKLLVHTNEARGMAKVTLGDPSPHRQPVAISKRAAA